jgi:NADPH:quinone reductase-like Zn-dependent oxidoreductase
VPEGEFSGVIVLVGPGVGKVPRGEESFSRFRDFQPGTQVFGCLPVPSLLGGEGTLAEYISISASQVCIVPENMKMEEAAGLSGAGLTAWAMLNEVPGKESIRWTRGQDRDVERPRVFINGSSGGVGTMLIQLAKAQGAYVVATCSERSRKLVKSLGADEVSLVCENSRDC